MLNYRSAGIFVIIMVALLLLLMIFWPQAGWMLIPLAVFYLILLIIGSARICSNFYIQAFCRGNNREKSIALTFDDGPDDKITPEVLKVLDKYQIRATFFLIGKNVESHPDLAKLIASKGHTIGIHSFSHHFWFDLYGSKKMERDLQQAEDIIRETTGMKTKFFRPPYGVTNPSLAKAVKKLGFHVIGWSVRSFDTSCKDAGRVAERVIKGIHPGAVILMHDTRDITPAAVEKIIVSARDKGYRFVGLEELSK